MEDEVERIPGGGEEGIEWAVGVLMEDGRDMKDKSQALRLLARELGGGMGDEDEGEDGEGSEGEEEEDDGDEEGSEGEGESGSESGGEGEDSAGLCGGGQGVLSARGVELVRSMVHQVGSWGKEEQGLVFTVWGLLAGQRDGPEWVREGGALSVLLAKLQHPEALAALVNLTGEDLQIAKAAGELGALEAVMSRLAEADEPEVREEGAAIVWNLLRAGVKGEGVGDRLMRWVREAGERDSLKVMLAGALAWDGVLEVKRVRELGRLGGLDALAREGGEEEVEALQRFARVAPDDVRKACRKGEKGLWEKRVKST